MGTSVRRIESLDGLRGAAALVVLLHHCLLVMPALNGTGTNATSWIVDSPLHAVWAGREAVFIFFILSGFVLTLPFIAGRAGWKAYYPTRLLRLYLPVSAAVLLGLVVVSAFPRHSGPGQSEWMQVHPVTFGWWSVVRDALLVAGPSNMNTPLWSLQWEVIFSLLVPAYIWIALKMRQQWLLLAAGAGIVMEAGLVTHVDALQYLPMFLLGAVLAVKAPDLIEKLEPWLAGRRGWFAFVVAVLGLTSVYSVAAILHTGVGTLTFPLVVMSAVAVVILSMTWPPAVRVLSFPFFRWAGRISFSLYLTHELVVVTVGQALPRRSTLADAGNRYPFGPDVCGAVLSVGRSSLAQIVTRSWTSCPRTRRGGRTSEQ
ncbi:acyltransferase [Curtobacterium sp. MCPF17_052]|uniref:acyltransferase family protein n=1 Tax=Curtobacterium sp. MCPF17_052 TaxID=2175655 RepID=UPI0024DF5D97|nr:acyltransferase [Curtobacterium sp. MCPF17_052]WIB11816.1 acyltransferase [Curtobacterium sp. MCPF17_052]